MVYKLNDYILDYGLSDILRSTTIEFTFMVKPYHCNVSLIKASTSTPLALHIPSPNLAYRSYLIG